MSSYFFLQFVMLNRKLREASIHPILAYKLAIVAFALFAQLLFSKINWAAYVMLFLCLSAQSKLSNQQRNDFLTVAFGSRKKIQVRIVENLLIALPFAMSLVYYACFLELALLCAFSLGLSFLSRPNSTNFTLATPFSSRPYEFAVGFRRAILVLILTYSVFAISVAVLNFDLGVFSMLVIFLVAMNFYASPETDYYVWIYSKNGGQFLITKMRMASIHAFILVLPILIALLLVYPFKWVYVFLFFVLGMTYLWTMILAKYAAFPNEIGIKEGILVVFCLFFPPVLLFAVFYFYKQSLTQLKPFLND